MGSKFLAGRVGWQAERSRYPHRIPTSPEPGGLPTGIPQTKRVYAVHDDTAAKVNENLLTSANAGKNGQRCFA
jgi:hypothetical protein